MLYKIKSIKHSGTCGERDTDRTDGRYPLRIGRIIDLNIKDIQVGAPLVIKYVRDTDGASMRWQVLRTSSVFNIEVDSCFNSEPIIKSIETHNSVFEFERVEDDE